MTLFLGSGHTVWLKWIAHFVVDILFLHICTVYSLGCTNLKDEQKIIEKWRTSSASTKFAYFWVVSVRKYMVKKYLISDRFDFLEQFFFRVFFYNSIISPLYMLLCIRQFILLLARKIKSKRFWYFQRKGGWTSVNYFFCMLKLT